MRPSATPEAGEEVEPPVCPPEPPKREIVRVTKATVKVKASAFSSVGSSSGKNGGGEAGGALTAAVFRGFHSSAAAARAEDTVTGDGEKAVEDGDGGGVRFDMEGIATGSSRGAWLKRKSPIGVHPNHACLASRIFPLDFHMTTALPVSPADGHEEHGSSAKARRVVVLGDDPWPRPRRMSGRSRPTRGGSRGEGQLVIYPIPNDPYKFAIYSIFFISYSHFPT